MRRLIMLPWIAAVLGVCGAALARPARTWPYRVRVEPANPKRRPYYDSLWIPEGVERVRGLMCACAKYADARLVSAPQVREALTELEMGALSFFPGTEGAHPHLLELAEKSEHPEILRVPLLLAGHGMGGVAARNAVYLAPERVVGVIHIKSGNLHHHIPDVNRTLAGVPILAVNGEFEETGPEGGDVGIGLRSRYALDPAKERSENQTQWVMLRMQLLERRRRNPSNLLSMVVERGGNSGSWDRDLTRICAAFVRGAARARLPRSVPPGEGPIACRTVRREDGWLSSADIKHFKTIPAPYAEYGGDKRLAFWYPDFATVEAAFNYHGRGWDRRDPTFGLPPEERFRPPPILRDLVDAPPPGTLAWSGGAGYWNGSAENWLDGRRRTAWDEGRQAVIDKSGSVVSLTNRITCAGVRLGAGCTLDLGEAWLTAEWNTFLDDASVLRVAIGEHDRPTRGGRVAIRGRGRVGGRLVVNCHPDNRRYGRYPIVKAGTPLEGAFAEIVLPEGWRSVVEPGSVYAEHVPPPKPPPKPKEQIPPPPEPQLEIDPLEDDPVFESLTD